MTQPVLGQHLGFLCVLGHQIYKLNGNLINFGVLIRKGVYYLKWKLTGQTPLSE